MGALPESPQTLSQLLALCLRAGQIMLENGANTARAERSIRELGLALGILQMEVYVTPTGIIATATAQGESVTQLVRILKGGVQLSRVQGVLSLLQHCEWRQLPQQLEQVAQSGRQYGPTLTALAVGGACGAFALLLGGGPREAGLAWMVAGLGQALRHYLQEVWPGLGKFFTTLLLATLITGVASWGARCWGLSQIGVAAGLLLLVPGVALVSSIADLFRGDTLAGMARASNAGLVVLTGGVGVWAALVLGAHPLELELSRLQHPLGAALCGGVGAAGFGVLFDVPRGQLPWAAGAGAIAVLLRCLALNGGWPPLGASCLAGLGLGLLAHGLERRRRCLSSLFSVPGFVPLVPGALAFRAVVHFANQNDLQGLAEGVQALLLLVAIAVGLGLSALWTPRR